MLFFVATVSVMLTLAFLGRGLEVGVAPYGILSFEFAGDLASAQAVVDAWGESGGVLAGFHLGLDYLFLVLYPSFIALGCALAIGFFTPDRKVLVSLGVFLAWGQVLAGALDAVENWALFSLLNGADSVYLPNVAWWCAAFKFALVIAGLAFLLLTLALALFTYLRKQKGVAA